MPNPTYPTQLCWLAVWYVYVCNHHHQLFSIALELLAMQLLLLLLLWYRFSLHCEIQLAAGDDGGVVSGGRTRTRTGAIAAADFLSPPPPPFFSFLVIA